MLYFLVRYVEFEKNLCPFDSFILFLEPVTESALVIDSYCFTFYSSNFDVLPSIYAYEK